MTQHVSTARNSAGFSLLEAIVALTIFSVCAVALFGWLATNMRAMARVEVHQAQVREGRNALALLESVNPMEEPKGERELPGGLAVRWTSQVVAAPRPGKGPAGNTLIFDLALYDLQVEVLQAGRQTSAFTVRRVGWKSARTQSNEL